MNGDEFIPITAAELVSVDKRPDPHGRKSAYWRAVFTITVDDGRTFEYVPYGSNTRKAAADTTYFTKHNVSAVVRDGQMIGMRTTISLFGGNR